MYKLTKITPEDIRLEWFGSVSSTTYTFWNQNVESGSIQQHIDNAESDLEYLLEDTWDSTDAEISANVVLAVLYRTCQSLAFILRGGIVTQGFDYNVGPLRVARTSGQISFYDQLEQKYKSLLAGVLYRLQPLYYTSETTQPSYGETAPAVM